MKYILVIISVLWFVKFSSGQCQLSVVDTVHVNCYGDDSGSVDLDVSSAASPFYLYLDNGVVLNDNVSFLNLSAADYVVYIEDANGCSDTISFKIKQPSELVLDLSCDNNLIMAEVSGGVTDYNLDWRNENGNLLSNDFEIEFQSDTFYNLELTDAKGCQIMDSIYLSIDFSVDQLSGDVPLDINITNYSTEGNFFWDFGDGTLSSDYEPSHSYLEVGPYDLQLVLTNEIGCEAKSLLSVNVQGFELAANDWESLPDAFSPNNDGINESFTFSENHAIAEFNVEVFNRWGNKVYQWSDPDGSFNGLDDSGSTLAEGVYFYRMVATGFDGKSYSKNSSITLYK